MVEKSDFLKVVTIPYPKNRLLVILRSLFSTFKFFPRAGVVFPVSTIKEECFNEKMTSVAGLKKRYFFSAKVVIFAIFGYLGQPSKSIFSTYRQCFKKSLVSFLEEVVRNTALRFQLSIFEKVRGGSRFASRHLPKTVILVSCNFVGWPFVASYACSIVVFPTS